MRCRGEIPFYEAGLRKMLRDNLDAAGVRGGPPDTGALGLLAS
jgi:hypothetical protein